MIVLSDNDVRGAVSALRRICESQEWEHLSIEIGVQFLTLEDIGLTDDSTDQEIWAYCQQKSIVLFTGDRSKSAGDDSLEQIIIRFYNETMIPVITIGDPKRVVNERDYAESCAARLLEYLLDIEGLRGVGRLFISPS